MGARRRGQRRRRKEEVMTGRWWGCHVVLPFREPGRATDYAKAQLQQLMGDYEHVKDAVDRLYQKVRQPPTTYRVCHADRPFLGRSSAPSKCCRFLR